MSEVIQLSSDGGAAAAGDNLEKEKNGQSKPRQGSRSRTTPQDAIVSLLTETRCLIELCDLDNPSSLCNQARTQFEQAFNF